MKLIIFIAIFTLSKSCFALTIVSFSPKTEMTPDSLEEFKVCLELREGLHERKSSESRTTYHVNISVPESINEILLHEINMRFSRDVDDLATINFNPKSRSGRSFITLDINQFMFEKASLIFFYSGTQKSHTYTLKLSDFKERYTVKNEDPSYNSYKCSH